MSRPRTLTPAQEDSVARWATRASGVTIPEIADRLGVNRWTARRMVLRLVSEGRLRKTEDKRRRTMIFERAGTGGIIFRATAREARKWVGYRILQGKPRSRGKWW